MAFNLKLVLKALLFSSSQPLSIKDVQAVLARFHDRAGRESAAVEPEEPVAATSVTETTSTITPTVGQTAAEQPSQVSPPESAVEIPASPEVETDADLYQGVPSLITATQIRDVMATLAEELRASYDIYLLIEGPSGYRLVTHPRFAGWIRILRDEPAPVKLTQSALETLAIVAYRQPVTRTEIEAIRGVSADAGLNKLIERELVYITGRADLPGRPLQYGTTDRFMDFVGVKSLVELPASDVLSPRQIDEWLKNASSIKTPTDAEMGLPLEEGEGKTPNLEEVEIDRGHPSPHDSPVSETGDQSTVASAASDSTSAI